MELLLHNIIGYFLDTFYLENRSQALLAPTSISCLLYPISRPCRHFQLMLRHFGCHAFLIGWHGLATPTLKYRFTHCHCCQLHR
jgi:hypothetical protein